MATNKKTENPKKVAVKKINLPVKRNSSIKETQKETSIDIFQDTNPSQETNSFWIYARRLRGEYPKTTINSGKWLIFVNIDNIDIVWGKIKSATEKGRLGDISKVATVKPNPNATKNNLKVICVYTYDYTDKDDVLRIRKELRDIGIINNIPYKTDRQQKKVNTRLKETLI